MLEVAGPLAMFARPDTGGTPTSYPAPTWSAAKGIFESIAFFADGAAWICPTKVEICRQKDDVGGRIQFQRYTTNYGGPERESSLRKEGIVSGGSSVQLFATILSNVCYRLYAFIAAPRPADGINARHHLQHLFNRRLVQGRCYRTPCLGWSEFTCSYWGSFRDGITRVDDALAIDIPSMLIAVWEHPVSVAGGQPRYAPRFTQGPQ
jgi:CRISPR-associated protein Cas5d